MNTAGGTIALLLGQWTALLAAAWIAHGCCRLADARWRVVLWRTVLCIGMVLPCATRLPVPRLRVPAPLRAAAQLASASPGSFERAAVVASAQGDVATSMPEISRVVNLAREAAVPGPIASPVFQRWFPSDSISWASAAATLWVVGAAFHLLRLFTAGFRLHWLVTRMDEPLGATCEHVRKIEAEYGIRQRVRIRVSEQVRSPFLCGILRPVLVLPRALLTSAPADEVDALLGHELAHQRHWDVVWCVAWQLAKAVLWFHPLMWRAPHAHGLAVEEEADRVAALRVRGAENYRALLARLVLRITDPPTSPLVLQATSDIARRLRQLQRCRRSWGRRHMAGAAAVGVALVAVTLCWEFRDVHRDGREPQTVEWRTIPIVVTDGDGHPVAGAAVRIASLSAPNPNRSASSFASSRSPHGEFGTFVTGDDGKIALRFPRFIGAQGNTAAETLRLEIRHPEYVTLSAERRIESEPASIQLERGIPIVVSATYGVGKQPVREFVPLLVGAAVPRAREEWQSDDGIKLSWHGMAREKYILLLMGRLPNGEIGYSDSQVFFGEQRELHEYALELKPGVRVEGRVDPKVPRPVRNGWVQLSVHARTYAGPALPAAIATSIHSAYWQSYRPIAADGTFVFESVPEGEAHVIAQGDGFASAAGRDGGDRLVASRQPTFTEARKGAQRFELSRPATAIEVATESTATVRVFAHAGGHPVRHARVSLWLNDATFSEEGTRLAGAFPSTEAPFRKLPAFSRPLYQATTDGDGSAIFHDVPAFRFAIGIGHPDFDLWVGNGPLARPAMEVMPRPGATSEVTVRLAPKSGWRAATL